MRPYRTSFSGAVIAMSRTESHCLSEGAQDASLSGTGRYDAQPLTVTLATPLKNVADILVRGRIGVVPAPPQARVVRVVTAGDLLRKEQLQRDPEGPLDAPCCSGPAGTSPRRDRRELMDRYPATVPAGTSVRRRPG